MSVSLGGAMTFKIHRGTKEIGGSCVEVWTETSRIVIDIGMPLANPDGTFFDARETDSLSTNGLIQKGILPDIPSLYQDGTNTALLISHSHQDHYGLMGHINLSCPVWLGKPTKLLIELINNFTGKSWKVENAHYFKHGKEFKIGDITITPYLMDHTAFDSYAFLIESGGQSIVYSSDFRLHGRESANFDWFCSNIKKNVDYLFLEGSTIGRTDKPFPAESDLEDEFIKTFKRTKGINLVYVSGQNIARLETIYRACHRCGKILLLDFYTAHILKTLNRNTLNTIPFPSRETFPDINVYFPQFLTNRMIDNPLGENIISQFRIHKIGRDKIDEMAGKLVMLVRPPVKYDLEKYVHNYTDGTFVYSMWNGYKEKDKKTKEFLDFIAGKGMPIKDIHTSGHADLSGLKRMVEVVKPKHIAPIHTFEGDKYPALFEGTNVRIVDDKETIEI
jgi:ribonuclease J